MRALFGHGNTISNTSLTGCVNYTEINQSTVIRFTGLWGILLNVQIEPF